jgi:hypothetical protein
VLDLGRRYAVVSAGLGVPLRGQADPSAPETGKLPFAAVVVTTGEASGADGKTWRRIEDRAWAPRENLLVFNQVREAVALAIELRVFSPPNLRAGATGTGTPSPRASPRPGTAVPGRTTTPTVSPTSTRTPTPTVTPRVAVPTATGTAAPQSVQRVVYAVVTSPSARLWGRPGLDPLNRPPLEVGSAAVVVDEATGPDGQRYARLEENVWLRSDDVATYGTLTEASEAAFQQTMRGLAPGVEVDKRVAPALWILRREPEFRYLADTIADERIPIRVGPLPEPRAIALYSFADRTITFSEEAVDGDPRVLAATLAHETTHAWEHKEGLQPPIGANCFEAELRAFRNQAELWEKFYGPKGKERLSGPGEADMNEVLRLFKESPDQLKAYLINVYGDQCGYQGPKPTLAPRPTASTGTPGVGTPVPGTPVPGKPGAAPSALPKPGNPAAAATKPGNPAASPAKPPGKP